MNGETLEQKVDRIVVWLRRVEAAQVELAERFERIQAAHADALTDPHNETP